MFLWSSYSNTDQRLTATIHLETVGDDRKTHQVVTTASPKRPADLLIDEVSSLHRRLSALSTKHSPRNTTFKNGLLETAKVDFLMKGRLSSKPSPSTSISCHQLIVKNITVDERKTHEIVTTASHKRPVNIFIDEVSSLHQRLPALSAKHSPRNTTFKNGLLETAKVDFLIIKGRLGLKRLPSVVTS
ncbi:hypothetical protein GWI33_022509 [Rhynchophorus ferrugineus]|uniref:Uncharacterized protein n=1 Tax=Rhynchophorus ferrugineus TaxID=354439 RepID=A0A834ISK4_RHYFE|nr:hypothetical protein GWI33_022509 [Rhynchophorus ferrugineus]